MRRPRRVTDAPRFWERSVTDVPRRKVRMTMPEEKKKPDASAPRSSALAPTPPSWGALDTRRPRGPFLDSHA